jgi:nucleoside-diphosphate-sugar epimerase
MVSILVTGSKGYIGTRLMTLVLESFPGALIYDCDIKEGSDYAKIRDCSFDTVFHLGAISTIISSFERANEMMDVNAFNLIPFFQNNKVKKFIFSSSASIYGEMKRPMREDEAKWTDCLSPYAQTKYVAEGIIRRMCPNSAIMRFGNVFGGDYGPREEWLAPTHFMHDNPIVLYGGTQIRDFIHVDLICNALIQAAKCSEIVGTYNLASGVAIRIEDIARLFSEERGVPIIYEPQRKGESMYVVLNIDKARAAGLLPTEPPVNDYRS